MIPRIAVVLALVLACTGERGAATGESSGDIKTVASTTASSTSTARKDSVRPVAHVPLPDTLRGLYVNRWVALGSKLNRLIEVARTTEINALVIDVKDDRGFVLYRSRVPLAREIGADTADGHWMSATRLRAVLDLQLREHVPHVRLHRFVRYAERCGDRTVRLAKGEMPQHLRFARRQGVELLHACEMSTDGGIDVRPSGDDGTNGSRQDLGIGILAHVAVSSRAQLAQHPRFIEGGH